MTDEERERLLALPAAALNSALGRNAPPFFYVQRKDGRTARHTLVTAIDRLRRRTAEHPDGGPPFAEAVAELERLSTVYVDAVTEPAVRRALGNSSASLMVETR